MITIVLKSDEINFLKEKYSEIYLKLLPYSHGNEFKFPGEDVIDEIDSAVNDAIFDEYDDEKDYMSDDGIKLEDIWSYFI